MARQADTPSALLDAVSPAQGHLFYQHWYADTARWVATDADLMLEVEGDKLIVGAVPNMTAGLRWTTRGRGVKETRFVGKLDSSELPPGRYEWHMAACGNADTDNVAFWMAVRVTGGATVRVDLTLAKSDGTPAAWQRGVVVFEAVDQGAEVEFGATLRDGQFVHIDQPFVAQTDPFLQGELAQVRAAAAERVQADSLQFTALRDKDKELADADGKLSDRVGELETRADKVDENLTTLDDRTQAQAKQHTEDTDALKDKDSDQDTAIGGVKATADEAKATAEANKAEIAGVKQTSSSADTRHKQQLESLDKQIKALFKEDDEFGKALSKLSDADITTADSIRDLVRLVGEVKQGDKRQGERLDALERADARIDGEIEPLGGRIAANTQTAADLGTRLKILEGNFDGHQHLTVLTQMSRLSASIGRVEADIAALKADDTTASKEQLEDLAGALDTVRTKVGEVAGMVEALGLSSGATKIAELQTGIAAAQEQDKQLGERIKLLEDDTRAGDNAQAVRDLTAQLAKIDGRLKGVEGSGSFFLDGKPPVIPEHLDDLWPMAFGHVTGWKHEDYGSSRNRSLVTLHHEPIAIPVPTADGAQENLIFARVVRTQPTTSSFRRNITLHREFKVGGQDETISIAVDVVIASERADDLSGQQVLTIRAYNREYEIRDKYARDRPIRQNQQLFEAQEPLPLAFYEGKTFVRHSQLILRNIPVPQFRTMAIAIFASVSPPYIDARKGTETVGGWIAIRPAAVSNE